MRIGPIDIPGIDGKALALAPMDDVTDMPFRRLCKRHGADLLYTEFIQSELLVHGGRRPIKRLEFAEEERPIGIQLYGSAEEYLREAVAIVEEVQPDFIDLNCGCWAKKIAMRGEGAGLLRDLDRFDRVVRTVVDATQLPVTVKTRLGWDASDIIILDAARMVEQCGAKALAVHCRTRNQGYQGNADWSWLSRIKEVISIPLLGNGDVSTPEDAKRMLETGCDGVMIGRGAICNPWIFEQTKHYLATGMLPPEPAPEARAALCLEHLAESCQYKGEARGLREFRKHYSGYLGTLPEFEEVRRELVTAADRALIEERIAERWLAPTSA